MRALTVSVAVAFLSASHAAADPMHVPVVALVIQGASEGTQPTTRNAITSALVDRGARVVDQHQLHAAVEGLHAPDLTSPSVIRALANELNFDGLVTVRIENAIAYVQVFGPDGRTMLTSRVPLKGAYPTREEADTIATVTMAGLALPAPAQPPSTAPAPNPDAAEIPSHQQTPYPLPPVIPPPEKLRIANLYATPTATWREATVHRPGTQAGLSFGTRSPYYGALLGLEVFPFLHGNAKYVGFAAEYGFAFFYAPANITFTTPAATQPTGIVNGTEDRLIVDLVGLVPPKLAGGALLLKFGFAYEGFYLPTPTQTQASFVSSQYVSPRLAVEYTHPLPAGFGFDLQAGVRYPAFPGEAQVHAFGVNESTIGADGRASIGGRFTTVLPALRWFVGFNYLYYADTFGTTTHINEQESYYQVFLGASYQL